MSACHQLVKLFVEEETLGRCKADMIGKKMYNPDILAFSVLT